MKKVGIIGYNSFTGQGEIIKRYLQHLPFDSHFVIKHPTAHKEAYHTKNWMLNTKNTIEDYINKFKPDSVFIIEKPFDWGWLEILYRYGIKTYVMPMVDCCKAQEFSKYLNYIYKIICPNKICEKLYFFSGKTIYLPYPIDTDYFSPKNLLDIKDKSIFLHNQGNGGAHWRKGTDIIAHICTKEGINCHINRQPTLHNFYKFDGNSTININEEEFQESVHTYSHGKIYLALSRREGLGLPILEAMSVGMPVVVTDIPPINEYGTDLKISAEASIKHAGSDVYDFIVDPDELIDFLIDLKLWTDDKIIEEGQKNRKYIINNFSWSFLRDKYIKELFND